MPNPEPTLPPLDMDCPDCTGPAGDAMREENARAWEVWNAEEEGAYSDFVAAYDRTHSHGGEFETWQRTDRYRELTDRRPEKMADAGCVECDWTGRRVTEAGRQVLAFLNVHYRKAGQ